MLLRFSACCHESASHIALYGVMLRLAQAWCLAHLPSTWWTAVGCWAGAWGTACARPSCNAPHRSASRGARAARPPCRVSCDQRPTKLQRSTVLGIPAARATRPPCRVLVLDEESTVLQHTPLLSTLCLLRWQPFLEHLCEGVWPCSECYGRARSALNTLCKHAG